MGAGSNAGPHFYLGKPDLPILDMRKAWTDDRPSLHAIRNKQGDRLRALHRPPNPFIGVDPAVVITIDPRPSRGRPIFIGAEIAVAVGIEARPVLGPIIRVVVCGPIEAAGPVAALEFAAADPAIAIGIREAVGTGAICVPLVAADEAGGVD